MIFFFVRRYTNEELCDGFRNKYIIVKDGKMITLIPLSPKQVYDDQIKMRRESEVISSRLNYYFLKYNNKKG